jgi:uroporphyrinogen-III synthase
MAESDLLTSKPIKTILVSQPQPTDASAQPFHAIEDKYGVKIEFKSFIKIEGLSYSRWRKNNVELPDYSAVVFLTKHAIEHFFSLCTEMRFKVSEDLKYFCLNEQIALYLQRFVNYRKRKVHFGERTFVEMKELLTKHRKKEKFLVLTSTSGNKDVSDFFKEGKFNYAVASIFETISADLKSENMTIRNYDMFVFFTPVGVKSLLENFPEFKQDGRPILCFSPGAQTAAEEHQLEYVVPESPALPAAIAAHLAKTNVVV